MKTFISLSFRTVLIFTLIGVLTACASPTLQRMVITQVSVVQQTAESNVIPIPPYVPTKLPQAVAAPKETKGLAVITPSESDTNALNALGVSYAVIPFTSLAASDITLDNYGVLMTGSDWSDKAGEWL
jgi:hypothetical protein